MIREILKWIFYLIVILVIFAFLPKNLLDKLKESINVNVLLKTLKTGWDNLVNFLRQATGIQFEQIPITLKEKFGLDVILFWKTIKNFLANFFEKLVNILK